MKKIIIRRQALNGVNLPETMHPVLRRVYTHRGVCGAQELNLELQTLLPFHRLKNIDEAAALLYDSIRAQKRILVIGDFDADGATSSALAVLALRAFGARHVHYLVPNRFEYGYGLTPEIVATAAAWQPDLIITVDNGIASLAGVAAAHEKGIEVLITDHHLPGAELPATVIVNPNQPDDAFPSKNLAGVGVIFYVMCALRRYLQDRQWFDPKKNPAPNMAGFLDLVALGTVADVVPLDQNNRILVHHGLQRIRAGHCRPGIKALLEIAKRNLPALTTADLGFAVGPRLNAAGRLDDMSLGIECLLTDDPAKARELAQILDELNQERRSIEADMQAQALSSLAKFKQDYQAAQLPMGLCLYDKGWHQGVIGILAARIKDHFHRPVIAFAQAENNLLKGSARSIQGLHIRDTLDAVATKHPQLISRFGGHAMAAGLSLEADKYTDFAAAFDAEVRRQLREESLQREIYSDGELSAADFQLELAELLRYAAPWGQAFPEPVFDNDFQVVSQRLVGERHLKLTLRVGDGPMLEAIAFNVDLDAWPNHRCQAVRAAYKLDVNLYQGFRSVQLLIDHLEAL